MPISKERMKLYPGGDDHGPFPDNDLDSECWNCGGEGFHFDCLDGCCLDADVGCDLCTRTCEVCHGKGSL